jgi:hypothetical protein
LKIFNIPHPDSLKERLNLPIDQVAYGNSTSKLFKYEIFCLVTSNHLIEAFANETILWRMTWGGFEKVAVGCSNGIL